MAARVLLSAMRDQIDLVGRLLLAFDFEERERAHRLLVAARMQRAERLAHLAVLERAMHRDQGIGRVIAERFGERDFLLGGAARRRRYPARRNARRAAAPAVRPAAARSASLASTICTSVDQPSDSTPRNAAAKRRARLAFELRRILVPEHERARHRPFAGLGRALEHERVGRIEPDGADQLHDRGPRVFGSSHDGAASSGSELPALDLDLAHAPHQQIAVLVDVAAQAFVARQALEIFLRDRARSRAPARRRCAPSDAARSSRPVAPAARSVKPSSSSADGQRMQARLAVRSSTPCGSSRRTPASPAARPRARPAARRAVRRRPARHRRGSHPASRSSTGFSGGA